MKRGVAILSSLLISGCTGAAEQFVVEVGVIETGPLAAMLQTPASVNAGETFEVTLITWGDSCVTSERTEIEVAHDSVRLVPYDRRLLPDDDEACFQAGLQIEHSADITIATNSVTMLIVQGRKIEYPNEELIEVAFPITVQ